MKVVLQTLSLAFLAASVSGQVCVEETLDCNEPIPGILKLGNTSCSCNNPAHAGSLKYVNGAVYVCLSSEWKSVRSLETMDFYGTEKNPGFSCKDIQDKAGQQLSDGVYWIRLRGKRIFLSGIDNELAMNFLNCLGANAYILSLNK